MRSKPRQFWFTAAMLLLPAIAASGAVTTQANAAAPAAKEIATQQPTNYTTIHIWNELPGAWYSLRATKSNDQSPIDVFIVSDDSFQARIYGPGFDNVKGSTVQILPSNLIRVRMPNGATLNGKVVDATTIRFENGDIIRKWIIPSNWYGKSGETVSVASGHFAFLDVVLNSRNERLKLVPVFGTNSFRVEGQNGVMGNWWSGSINIDNGGDQYTPYPPKQTGGGEYRGPLGR